ncbi:acyl-CoA thioester hydrolase [Cyclonatronum proteinivorum]|uniref:Acyl-CoA thioester hydrolase n=2 Tax=Cyclonatronum proteinivorum TaxID=1457365 RepID=A0A345UJX2_9BACT|nr:acyl-CoA thioester hydrolase [Cyclonatronum proteinivorum]
MTKKMPDPQLQANPIKSKQVPLYTYELKLRSRYAETDKMGYVYHGRFLEYFEQARTEMIREAGISYLNLEEMGVMLPVAHVSIDYMRPVFYDELITIRVLIFDPPSTRLNTWYEVVGEDGKTRLTAHVVLVFVSEETRRPCPPPAAFLEGMKAVMHKEDHQE